MTAATNDANRSIKADPFPLKSHTVHRQNIELPTIYLPWIIFTLYLIDS